MALYHKHRPQTFDLVIGQDHIIKTIANQIKNGRVAHAYLFSGSRGVGKTTTARLLAKALNCENRKEGKSEPCDSCHSCQEISGSRSIDVIEIDAASHTGVDNVRENIIENAQFKPTKSPYKVFIIDEVHMLSTSAFNALLKTLEEPPPYVVFILATTESHKLPETIISRCQRFAFKKVAYDILNKHLERIAKEEKVKIDKEVMDRIINKSDGCVRDAVSLLDQIMATGEKNITAETASLVLPASPVEETLGFITALINKQSSDGLDIINKLASEGARFAQFANDAVGLLRIMMIMKATGAKSASGIDLSDEMQKDLRQLGERIEYLELVHLIDMLMARGQEIQSAPLPQMPLELAIIEWSACKEQRTPQMTVQTTNNDHGTIINNKQTAISKPEDRQQNIDSQTKLMELDNNDEHNEPDTKSRLIEKVMKVKDLVIRDKDSICSAEEAKDKWPELLKTINGDSPSLTFILKMAEVNAVVGNIIQISVAYSFHKDKLECKKCKKQIESALSEILNKKVHIDVIVQEKKEESEKEVLELQELAGVLGGEVIS